MRWGTSLPLLIAAAAFTGCFKTPTYEGRLCSSLYPCPSGFACGSDGRCQAAGASSPASPNDPMMSMPAVECASDRDCQTPGACEIEAGAACRAGRCSYAPMRCDSPPAAECLMGDSIYRSYSGIGSCSMATGACEYASKDAPCANCSSTCIDGCANVLCSDTHGGCRSQGFCTQTSTQPATCAYTDAPNGTACILSDGHTHGTCSSGDCFECSADRDCADPNTCQTAQGASCQNHRCVYAPVSCGAAPPPQCLMGDSVLRIYSGIGACDAATNAGCQYPSMDVACPNCTATCLNPCLNVSCNDSAGGCQSQGFCRPGLPGKAASCQYVNAPDETACSSTAGGRGVCQTGACVQCIIDHDCDDGDPCTIDQCSGSACVHTQQASACPRCDGPHRNLAFEADGRTAILARGPYGAVYGDSETAPGSGAFTVWSNLTGSVFSGISVIAHSDGRLEAFARGVDSALWHAWQSAPNGSWSAWASLGGTIDLPPQVGINADGRLEVFARVPGGNVYHIWQRVGAPTTWSAWANLGGSVTSNISVATNADGRIEVFGRGADNAMWHIWQVTAGGAWAARWYSLGGSFAGSPVAVLDSALQLEVYARAHDGSIQFDHNNPNGVWSGWTSLGGNFTCEIDVATNGDGRIEVFARGPDNAIYHAAQATAGGAFSAWTSLGGAIIDGPAAIRGVDGRMTVFGLGVQSSVEVDRQSAPGVSTYAGWSTVGGLISSF